MTIIRGFLPPEAASIDPHGPYCEWINVAHMEEADDMAGLTRTESGFISFDPVPLDTAKRIARTAQEKAMRAGAMRPLPSIFGELV
jgi:hypothetical protein